MINKATIKIFTLAFFLFGSFSLAIRHGHQGHDGSANHKESVAPIKAINEYVLIVV